MDNPTDLGKLCDDIVLDLLRGLQEKIKANNSREKDRYQTTNPNHPVRTGDSKNVKPIKED